MTAVFSSIAVKKCSIRAKKGRFRAWGRGFRELCQVNLSPASISLRHAQKWTAFRALLGRIKPRHCSKKMQYGGGGL